MSDPVLTSAVSDQHPEQVTKARYGSFTLDFRHTIHPEIKCSLIVPARRESF